MKNAIKNKDNHEQKSTNQEKGKKVKTKKVLPQDASVAVATPRG